MTYQKLTATRLLVCVCASATGCATHDEPIAVSTARILNGAMDFNDRVNHATVALMSAFTPPIQPTNPCTGTLITSNVVLTAAHCVYGAAPMLHIASVRVGLQVSTPTGSEMPTYTEFAVSGCYRHPEAFRTGQFTPGSGAQCYTGTATGNLSPVTHINADRDVALLILAAPVPRLLARPRPVGFDPVVPSSTTIGRMTGYGDRNMIAYPDTRVTGVGAITLSDFAPQGATFINHDILGIVQASESSTIFTNGDSGSPLLFPADQTGAEALAVKVLGVASYSLAPNPGVDTGVYTDLSADGNRRWLQSVLNDPMGDPDVVPTTDTNSLRWYGEGDDLADNCPGVFNPSQDDSDSDGRGDACDLCPGQGTSAGDEAGARFRGAQPNCNSRAEGLLAVPAHSDACDPNPCNPIDEINDPIQRIGAFVGSGTGAASYVGSNRLYLGMAPRVGTGVAAPFALPSDLNPSAGLASPSWRCVCLNIAGEQAASEQCYATGGMCQSAYQPLPSASVTDGFGWRRISFDSTTAMSALPTEGVFYGGGVAPRFAYVSRMSRADAAREWRTAVGEANWVWSWNDDPLMPSNLPRWTETVEPSDPAEVVFWSRAQFRTSPGNGSAAGAPVNDTQRAQHLSDSYSPRGVSLVNEHLVAIHQVPFTVLPPNGVLNVPVDSPVPEPHPMPDEELVGRYLTVLYPFTSQAQFTDQFFVNGGANQAIRGLTVGLVDVRQARLVMSCATQGAASDLPVYQKAVYATTPPDAQGWGDLAAFGGRDAGNVLTNNLFYTTHAYDASGVLTYTWHKAPVAGAPPTAREGAAVTFNATGKRLYVVGGRNDGQAFDDVRYYDLVNHSWNAVPVSAPLSKRYDVGLAIDGDTLFIGGGASWGGNTLGDLYEINGLTGSTISYGNALPQGGHPWMAFDDHGHGLLYAGGYVGATWYRDVWQVTLRDRTATSSFVYNFASDGMVGTPDYAVVADFHHGMYWGVPGYNAGGATQSYRFLRDSTSTLIQQGGGGAAAARIAAGPTVPTSPERQLRRTDSLATSTMISTRGARASSTATPR